MVLTPEEWASEYVQGAQAKASKLVRKFSKARPIIAAATSDAAVTAFKTNVVSPLAVAKRNFKLKALTDDDLKRQMSQFGASAYTQGVQKAAKRASVNVADFLTEIDRIRGTLPGRSADAATNVTNRVLPIATGLQNKAKSKYGAA